MLNLEVLEQRDAPSRLGPWDDVRFLPPDGGGPSVNLDFRVVQVQYSRADVTFANASRTNVAAIVFADGVDSNPVNVDLYGYDGANQVLYGNTALGYVPYSANLSDSSAADFAHTTSALYSAWTDNTTYTGAVNFAPVVPVPSRLWVGKPSTTLGTYDDTVATIVGSSNQFELYSQGSYYNGYQTPIGDSINATLKLQLFNPSTSSWDIVGNPYPAYSSDNGLNTVDQTGLSVPAYLHNLGGGLSGFSCRWLIYNSLASAEWDFNVLPRYQT